jgi:hypothetical protein
VDGFVEISNDLRLTEGGCGENPAVDAEEGREDEGGRGFLLENTEPLVEVDPLLACFTGDASIALRNASVPWFFKFSNC